MREIRFILITLLCLLTFNLNGQKKKQSDKLILVDVTIVDTDKEPLPGATIKISNKAQGVSADIDGKASLWVDKNAVIEFSYISMKPLTMKVTKPISGFITLEPDSFTFDEVVVTGYSTTTKRRSTGSLATIGVKELKTSPIANMDMLMQGKVAGVNVKAVSGRPGATSKIRIRGTNTISGNADPLWVIDGVPLQRDQPKISSHQVKSGDFNDIFANGISGINPNDIESVTVLKDASAAAIYGSRAAGGVIVVTTKRGEEGKMRVNYSANVSVVTKPSRTHNLMNSNEKLNWEEELWNEFAADGFKNNLRYPVVGAYGMIRSGYGKYAGLNPEEQNAAISELRSHSTNWFNELFRNSISQDHFLSLSGGSRKSKYYISMGYSQNNGLVKKTDYNRYNVNAKIDMNPNEKIKLGFKADMAFQKSNSPSMAVDPFKYAYFANPYERPYNDDGSYAADNTYFELKRANGVYDSLMPKNGYNIFREMNETSSKAKNFSTSLSANLTINIIDNLRFEGLASYGYVTDNNDNINGKNTFAAWKDRPFDINEPSSERRYGSITQSSSYNTNYNLRGQFYYSKTLGEHYLSGLLGSEIRGQYSKSIYEKRYGYDPISGNSSTPAFPQGTKEPEYADLIRFANIVDGLAGQSIIENTFASFYGSIDYVLKKRYILSLTARTDGSNNFGSDEQFNPTGSIGFSWNVDQESFMQALKPIVSSLSIRTAIGYTGNINKSVYPQLVMDYSASFRKTDDDYFRIGWLKNAPNPHLKWEKTRDMKISVDLGLFKDRLHLQGELYNRRTNDAVTGVLVPYTTGFHTLDYNTSEIINEGAELTVNGIIINKNDWRLSASANLSYNRNELSKYNSPNHATFSDRNVGYPLGAMITGKPIGIDRILGIYAYEQRPDVKFNTVADRRNSYNYAFYCGTTNAPTNGGFSISGGYKNFNISLGGSYSIGGKVINHINCPVDYSSIESPTIEKIPTQENDLYVNHLNTTKDATHRWTPENPITDGKPRIIDAYGEYLGLENYMTINSQITRASMMETINYVKLNSILLSYSFGEKVLKKLHLSSMSLSFCMNNVFVITNYSGLDPETPGIGYPTPKTFSTGLSIGF